MEITDKIIADCKKQILAGVLLKNVKRGLINDGIPEDIATKITRIAELEANEFSENKAK